MGQYQIAFPFQMCQKPLVHCMLVTCVSFLSFPVCIYADSVAFRTLESSLLHNCLTLVMNFVHTTELKQLYKDKRTSV